jgi:hypothetical protein
MTVKRGLANTALSTTNQPGTNTNSFLNQKLFPYPCMEFAYERKSKTEDAKAYRAGRHVIEETIESETEYSLKLKTQITNWAQTGLARGQIQRTLSSITVPVIKRAKINAAGEVLDSLITANLPVLASIESYGAWGQAGAIPVADITVTAGKLAFPSTLAGATITYMFDRTMATARAYGGAGTLSTMDEFQMIGYIKDNSGVGEDGFIWLPQMRRKTLDVDLKFTGKLIEFELEFTPVIPAGWEEPDLEVDGHSIVWA